MTRGGTAASSEIITDKATPEAERARYLRAFDFIKGPEKNGALVKLLTMATAGE